MNKLVTVNNGVATTTSLIIAEQFGRKHSHVLRSIEKFDLTRYEIVPSAYVDESGKSNRMYSLTERQALIIMPFIGGQKSIDGQERLVDAFLAMRRVINGNTKKSLPSSKKTLVDVSEIVHAVIFDTGRAGISAERLIFLCDDFTKLSKANREIVLNQLIATNKIVKAYFSWYDPNFSIAYLDYSIYEKWVKEDKNNLITA
jgi:Rha family phage regulatory protein